MNVSPELRVRLATALTEAIPPWWPSRPDVVALVREADALCAREVPDYIGSTEEGRDFLVDEIMEGGAARYPNAGALALHVVEVVTAE